ncbi:hypothetical protein DL93DRAFT_2165497 [Clavulina sp. PMI_390]|nr:hypothetical protein DL93DRAFT_2165497 [Clavulina sp. PMI_390]
MQATALGTEPSLATSLHINGSIGYAIAVPPRGGVAVGLILAAIAMAVVTLQVVAYSTRFHKERKVSVIIVNVIFLYSLASLAFLGKAVYEWLIAGPHSGNIDHVTVPQRYVVAMVSGVGGSFISSTATRINPFRTDHSPGYSLKLFGSWFKSQLIGLAMHLLTASDLGEPSLGFTPADITETN